MLFVANTQNPSHDWWHSSVHKRFNLPNGGRPRDSFRAGDTSARSGRRLQTLVSALKTWFITGASRGWGRAVCLAALSAGHRVVAAVRDPKDQQGLFSDHPGLLVVVLDITDAAQARGAVGLATSRFGGIDVLVNGAGYGELGWFEAMSDAHIRRQFEVNVFGTMNVTRAVLPAMRRRRSGRILTFSGVAGLVAVPTASVYCASKFAVEGWMEALAVEVSGFGIRCTLVEPGYFPADPADSPPERVASCSIRDYEQSARALSSTLSAKTTNRPGDLTRLASVILDLALLPVPPLRFAAGTDAINAIKRKIETMRLEYVFFESLSTSTDIASERTRRWFG